MTHQFQLSPLIRYTLYGLYISLVLPMPFLLHQQTNSPLLTGLLLGGLSIGLVILNGLTSQQVRVDEKGIEVSYPSWVPEWFQTGWAITWSDIQTITMSSTSQGGLAYYLQTHTGTRYLLPMRILGFRRFLALIQERLGIETGSINPYVQPWMYLVLALCTGLLLLSEVGLIWLSNTTQPYPG